jgi:hypothetical protein
LLGVFCLHGRVAKSEIHRYENALSKVKKIQVFAFYVVSSKTDQQFIAQANGH